MSLVQSLCFPTGTLPFIVCTSILHSSFMILNFFPFPVKSDAPFYVYCLYHNCITSKWQSVLSTSVRIWSCYTTVSLKSLIYLYYYFYEPSKLAHSFEIFSQVTLFLSSICILNCLQNLAQIQSSVEWILSNCLKFRMIPGFLRKHRF